MTNPEQLLFISKAEDIKYVYQQIKLTNAKWDGDKCPHCYQILQKQEKFLFMHGYVLECPECKKRYDRAEDFIEDKFTTINMNPEELESREIRKLLNAERHKNKSIEDFIQT